MTARRPWTEEELAVLRREFAKSRTGRLARDLGRSYSAVEKRAWKMGLSGDGCHPWTDGELALLRERYASTPTQELAAMLGKTEQAVSTKACKLDLKKDVRHKRGQHSWTAADDAVLRECAETVSARETAERLGRTVDAVLSRASKVGVRFTGPRRRFEKAWPPELEAKLRAGARAGHSLNLLAEEVGKTAPSVLKALRRLGIGRAPLQETRRPWGRPKGVKDKTPRKAPARPSGAKKRAGMGNHKAKPQNVPERLSEAKKGMVPERPAKKPEKKRAKKDLESMSKLDILRALASGELDGF